MPWKSEVRFLSNACVPVAQASRFPFFTQSVQGRPTIRSYLATNGRCRHSHHHGVFRDGLSVTAGHGHARHPQTIPLCSKPPPDLPINGLIVGAQSRCKAVECVPHPLRQP